MQSNVSFLIEVVYVEKMMQFLQEDFCFGEFRLLLNQKTNSNIGLW